MKYIPCRICASKKGPSPGYYYADKKPLVAIECACHKKWRVQQDTRYNLRQGNLWTDFDYDPLTDYKGIKSTKDIHALIQYKNNFDKKKNIMVYAHGLNGTQKTTLAMWLGISLVKEGYKVFYTLMESLSAALTPNFDEKGDDSVLYVQKALSADLLIIDEAFDRSKVTLYKSGYQLPFLDRFLRERFDVNRRGILFISNQPASTINESGFGESLQSFVSRNTCESTLYFQDKYISNANAIDSKRLFYI